MTMRRCCLFAVGLLSAACGGSREPAVAPEPSRSEPGGVEDGDAEAPPPPPPASRSDQIAPAEPASEAAEEEAAPAADAVGEASKKSETADDFALLEGRYDDFTLALARGPQGCQDADRLREMVCALAERICKIAEDLPDSKMTSAKCDDGRRRCEDANERYAEKCQ